MLSLTFDARTHHKKARSAIQAANCVIIVSLYGRRNHGFNEQVDTEIREKLAYHACDQRDKHWYNTVPNNVPKINIESCCDYLIQITKGKKSVRNTTTVLCTTASKYGHLDCLITIRSLGLGLAARPRQFCPSLCLIFARQMQCSWDSQTCRVAARNGHVECLKYAHEHGCLWDNLTSYNAVKKGHFHCLKYALDNNCPSRNIITYFAAANGNLNCLRYAHEKIGPSNNAIAFFAALGGHLNCLKYVHEKGLPWDESVCNASYTNRHLDCLEYARKHGCPMDRFTRKRIIIHLLWYCNT
ncbi:hypothetical protein AGLY_014312 [Aphis glycines]|uniref:Uncharacterized protein n=1 Tax=Aphis glycines TaxID=307491 RepID=A0A6G0T4X3_APHGL|nr:hypothetical protein AGLY_014312 [Aphis glycines]